MRQSATFWSFYEGENKLEELNSSQDIFIKTSQDQSIYSFENKNLKWRKFK